jgi:putative ABC transport system ATP-binding protein
VIELRDVSRVFRRAADEVHALERVSLVIPAARFVALMGPSGSGKSTLLNILAGLDRPSAGCVIVAGQKLDRLSEDELAAFRARHVGFVFQFFNLIPVLSARENVELPLLLTPLKKAERRARAETALRVVGLTERADHRPAQLSGGEAQRAAVVRALVNRPKLLLADEPTGSLDRASAESLSRLLFELNREEKVALVIVTHAADLAATAGRVLRMRDGVLE